MINPSANVFVFGDFNVHHKDWLTYSSGTDRPGELCYNFSISNDLTQMVNFPTRISDCDSRSPALLDLFLCSDASICSTMDFSPLGNLDYVVASVSINFLSRPKLDASFHHLAYDYSRVDWDDLRNDLRDLPWKDIFKLGVSGDIFKIYLSFCTCRSTGRLEMDLSSRLKIVVTVPEAAKLEYVFKTKEIFTSQKLDSLEF